MRAQTSMKMYESTVNHALEDKPLFLSSILLHSLRAPIESNLLMPGGNNIAELEISIDTYNNDDQQGSGVQTIRRDLWKYYG